ncbi:hypothetical protein DGMP_21240 [Desulfomarina profundi]|uniref:Tetratricopeptide repeat protein n=1 Tax=Desulfomarina profundi TaxID=2772557 RepID=A0A8D5JRV2_9BACT|nr:tetratricopeptide repeat protein [Desulfomarina profundi]BCL61431.1 hypothetical protein DGMP_21240 [Desulfomarina profundi]
MRFQNIIILGCSVLLLSGCGVGQAVKNSFQGTRYLQTKEYSEGESTFRATVANNPTDPLANYYLGRFLLARKKSAQALPYLKKAVSLNRKDADYLFWQGVAQGELGLIQQERKSYQAALAIKEKHLQAMIYLGHNLLKDKDYEASLAIYQKVLHIWPSSPSALYNRALIARILKRRSEEKVGWLSYLSRYPSGNLAILATNHLNSLGDFSYRNHHLRGRTITLANIQFKPFTAVLSKRALGSLNVIGATVSNIGNGKLQVLVFQENNKDLARLRAVSIKKYLLEQFPALTTEKIGISWFDKPEKTIIDGKRIANGESVRFFLTAMDTRLRPAKKLSKS